MSVQRAWSRCCSKAVHLDPKLGAAYLQLGILYSQRKDFSRAISAYQKAIEVSPEEVSREQVTPEINETLEVAHYRLAQAYLRTGDKVRAQEELQLHAQLAKKTKDKAERERARDSAVCNLAPEQEFRPAAAELNRSSMDGQRAGVAALISPTNIR